MKYLISQVAAKKKKKKFPEMHIKTEQDDLFNHKSSPKETSPHFNNYVCEYQMRLPTAVFQKYVE